jgi:hypothetical protein
MPNDHYTLKLNLTNFIAFDNGINVMINLKIPFTVIIQLMYTN